MTWAYPIWRTAACQQDWGSASSCRGWYEHRSFKTLKCPPTARQRRISTRRRRRLPRSVELTRKIVDDLFADEH